MADGLNVKAIVMINPGNPTGIILSEDTTQSIIKFAVDKKLVVIADEVYRENLDETAKYSSFRKSLGKMDDETRKRCEMVSLNGCSKGIMGECGFRAGYMYLHNIKQEVRDQLTKMKSIALCSNAVGQAMVAVMVNPDLENVTEQTRS